MWQDAIWAAVRLVLYALGLMTFALFNAAYLSLLERKVPSWFQLRRGPTEVGPYGLIQPIADGVKLVAKQLLMPSGVDRILFLVAPVLVMVPPIVCLTTIPFGETIVARSLGLGVLAIFAFSAFGTLGLLLAGWSSNNKYSSISAARVVAQTVAYEIPLLLTVLAVVLVSGTFDLRAIVGQQAGGFWHWNILRLTESPLMPVAFLVFCCCMLAETNRAPFDMVEAESELVAGAFTEFSGMWFGLFFMAEYINVVIGCSMATILFLGGWHCPLGLLPGPHWFLIKMYALCFGVMWVRWTFPRIQFYGLLNFSWQVLIPVALVNLVLTAVMMKVF